MGQELVLLASILLKSGLSICSDNSKQPEHLPILQVFPLPNLRHEIKRAIIPSLRRPLVIDVISQSRIGVSTTLVATSVEEH